MKVFVSLPITGCEKWARKEAARVKSELVKQGYEVVTPFECAPEPNKPIGYYMGRCIEALLSCDAVCQNPYAFDSKGCRLEDVAMHLYDKKRVKYPYSNRYCVEPPEYD